MHDFESSVASYLMKYMLTHKRIDLALLKDEFGISDKDIRLILIRLYNKNQVFGKIVRDSNDKEKAFLFFRTPEEKNNAWGVKDILDCDISELGIDLTQNPTSLGKPPRFSTETWHQLTQNIDTASVSELQASSLKESDQKGLVSIAMQFKIIGFYIALIIIIQNKSEEPIYQGKLRINLTPDLPLASIRPSITHTHEESQIVIEVGDVVSNSVANFRLSFHQELPGIIEANGFFQFYNFKKTARIFKMESIAIDTAIPIINPCVINDEEVRVFMNNSRYHRKIQGFGFSHPIPIFLLQSIWEDILQAAGFFLVSDQRNEQNNMSLFFGKALRPRPKEEFFILVAPQMKKNIFAFFICCEYEVITVNLLRILCLQFQKRLVEKKLLQSNEQLIDMNCAQCGTLLEIFPPKGELIGCKKCHLIQNPW